jgi:hypothetical protein
VQPRPRHDGWTPERQVEFIEALAECACVEEAAARVGMSVQSAYALRRRVDAVSFRIAWDAALDYGVRRLSDAVFSRALKGVARPVFYQGEQVGERRYFDERLAMFILRYRDPKRYGAWLDGYAVEQHPDGPALLLNTALDRVMFDAFADAAGRLPPRHPPYPFTRIVSEDEQEERRQARLDAIDRRRERAEQLREEREEREFWDSFEDPEGARAAFARRSESAAG